MKASFKTILVGSVISLMVTGGMPILAQGITITIENNKPESPPSATVNPPFEGKRC
jgi:hypothetical protein